MAILSISLMNTHQRQEELVRALQDRSPLTVSELEIMLGASPATIRRDLDFLEKAGKLVRTHGSVHHPDQFQGEASFDRKSRRAIEAKVALARAAAALVEPGANVFVDAGTSALEVGRQILQGSPGRNITIYTNSIPLLSERLNGGARVVALGGEVRQVSLALTGALALEWLRRLRFDVAFLGASGLDPADGATTTEISEAALKTAVLARAKRVAIVADAAKWGAPAAIRYADWSQIDDLFTDYRPLPSELALLSKHHRLQVHHPRP